MAAKHKADIVVVDQRRDTLVQRAADLYVRQLSVAEKEALGRSQLANVAVIAKERDSVKAGQIADLIAKPYPENLPETVRPQRATFFESFKRYEAEAVKGRQQADSTYLRSLSRLDTRQPGKAELAGQIKAERDAILASATAPPADDEQEIQRRVGILLNGDFLRGDSKGFPLAWKLVDAKPNKDEDRSVPEGETYKVVLEDYHGLLHTAFAQPGAGFEIVQNVDIPSNAKEVEFIILVRGKIEDQNTVRYDCRPMDENGSSDNNHIWKIVTPESKWREYSGKVTFEKAYHHHLRIALNNRAKGLTGYVDYARIELKFK